MTGRSALVAAPAAVIPSLFCSETKDVPGKGGRLHVGRRATLHLLACS